LLAIAPYFERMTMCVIYTAACNDGGGEQLLLASTGFVDFFNLLKPKDFMQCVSCSLHLLQMADEDLELHWMANPAALCWRC
jgi:hypothetical protein